ncbi:hypothetical protein [Paraburkholderia terrae]|uniref:hypothetical protein n=1 Tax=Paraburkholderia terrae TaxID=311230 RepID=UPI001EE2979D|nr:hypothetical protein [Paraburkholderia terrae]GJH00218.1 hypothetical protein CBA19C8_06695 [Paraburkholderia terrae]
MKIKCILLRQGGTHVELRGTNYHFAPQADGQHVAEVTDEAHIARFLSIPEAYRVVVETAPAVVVPETAAAKIPEPTSQYRGDPALSGITTLQGNAAWTPPPANPPQGGEQSQGDQGGEKGSAPESDDGEPVTDQSELRKLLAAQYKERFGRLPHGKWDAARIDEELKKSVE